jgi:hypothetical protein
MPAVEIAAAVWMHKPAVPAEAPAPTAAISLPNPSSPTARWSSRAGGSLIRNPGSIPGISNIPALSVLALKVRRRLDGERRRGR